MEFIAEDPVHVVVASEQPAVYDTKGRMVSPKQRKLFAKFQRGIAPEYAIEVALETFAFRKIHLNFPRERWFGYYNSADDQLRQSWTDEERGQIEARLVEQGYLQVTPRKLAAPWPAYDKIVVHGQRRIEHVAAKIAETVTELEIPAARVAAYERQTLNRPEVLAALEALSVEDEPEPLIAA